MCDILPPHNRYVWKEKLKQSIFGEIQLALDTVSQTHVAIKLSKTSLLNKRNKTHVCEDPRKEIKLINQVNCHGAHVNVIHLLDTFQVEDYECAVLPFCSGGDLFDRVGDLSNDDKYSAFLQLVSGLHHIHAQGVAHLDVSLENVLIDDHGSLKICDFGLARKCTEPPARVGKLFYMAIELVYPDLQGKSYDCRMCDMYSLGVCLFIIYTGFQPYEAPNNKCRSFAILAEYGVRALLHAYGVLDSTPEQVLTLLEVLLCPLRKRVNITELFSLIEKQIEDKDVDSFFNCDQDFNPCELSFWD